MRRQLFVAALILLSTPFAAAQTQPVPVPTVESLTTDYNAAMTGRDWAHAIAQAQQLVQMKPSSLNLKLLGNAQLYSGASGDALATYEKALAAADTEKPAAGQSLTKWNDDLSEIYIGRGNAHLKLKQNDEAFADYKHAAELATNAGRAWFNVCAVYYNTGNTKDSAEACRKCVAADPTRANAWFVLASDLFADAPIENGKVAIPEEGRKALEKYMELAPNGPHAEDVKAMLKMLK